MKGYRSISNAKFPKYRPDRITNRRNDFFSKMCMTKCNATSDQNYDKTFGKTRKNLINK